MFWPQYEDTVAAPKPKAPKPIKPQDVVDTRQTGCDACALKATWGRIATPRMKLSGNRKGTVLCLAEAPGEAEDEKGEALIGPSGKLLRDKFPSRFRDRIAFQNIVRCRPDKNRDPTAQEMHCCSVHLDADLASMPNLKVIMGLGATPLKRYFPGASIMRVHGLKFPVRVGNRTVWYWPVMHPAFVLHSQSESEYDAPPLPVFTNDVQNCLNEMDTWPAPRIITPKPEDVALPQSYAEAKALIDQLSEPLGLDLETLKLRPYELGAELLTAAISDDKTAVAWSINHPQGPTSWGLRLLLEIVATKRWVAHNAAFELAWLRHYGADIIAPFEDSMAVARLYHERESALGLAEVSHLCMGVNVKKIVEVNTERILSYNLQHVLRYNGLDSIACRLCWQLRIKSLNQANYQRLLGCIDSTCGMELMGLPISQPRALELKKQWLDKQQAVRHDARTLYEVRMFEAERATEFKITSPDDVGNALVTYGKLNLPKTKSGQFSTDEQVLNKYADNPLVRAVLDDREANKIISTYIEPTLEVQQRYPDGMLHPTYTVMFTSTQRLSSRDPNIQNYPGRTNGEIRSQVIAPPGYLFLKFDYGQLEARVLAMASRDKILCQSIIDKFDIHSHWLAKVIDEYYEEYLDRLAAMFGITDEKQLRKKGRDVIKSDLVFNALYGGGADSIADRTGIPLDIVKDILFELWDTYRGVKTWHKDRRAEYRETGAIRTLTGRVRRGILKGNEPINTPIQGSGADIVIEAQNELAALSRKERDPHLHPRIQLHDDLTFLVPANDVEYYIDTIHPILTKVRFPWQIVPLSVEVKVGEDWATMYEVAIFTGGYVR